MKKLIGTVVLIVAAASLASGADLYPYVIYNQGFEANTSGWTAETGGTTPGTITSVPSGGGTLHLTAPGGSSYAEITNSPGAYPAGPPSNYGDYGFDSFGGNGSAPQPYPGGSFAQSVDVYIDPAALTGSSFWIDFSPSTLAPGGDPLCGSMGCGDEHNFRLTGTASGVQIGTDVGSVITTINSAEWLMFQITYSKGANSTDPVENTLNVFSGSTQLGSAVAFGNSDGEGLESQNLGGPGYVWFTVAQNNAPTLGIDNIQARSSVPEPISCSLAGLGLVVLGLIRKRRAS